MFAKQDKNLLVVEAFSAQVDSDLSNWDAPGFEQQPLRLEYILVEDVQARTRSKMYSGAAYWLE